MKRVICGLWMVLFLCGAAHAAKPGITVKVLARTSSSWDGSPLPAYPKGQPQITILRITIPGGVTLPVHEHPVINAGVLLSGRLIVKTEAGKTLYLKPGDPIVEVVKKWHYGKNPGKKPAVIIVFYAGTPGTPVTVLRK